MGRTREAGRHGPEAGGSGSRLRVLALGRRRHSTGYIVAIGGALALTAIALPFRDQITPLSKGFGYLVIVVVAAAIGGLGPGIVASILGFMGFNFFFIPPYQTFAVRQSEDLTVIFVFLGLSVLISALLARAQERALAAEAREAELELLQSLSAELVALAPKHDAYASVIADLLGEFGFAEATLLVERANGAEERMVVTGKPGTVERPAAAEEPGPLGRPGGVAAEPVPEERPGGDAEHDIVPLMIGGRSLGALALRGDRPDLTSGEVKVLRAFCNQLAMALERDRLLAIETDAEALRKTDTLRKALLAAVSHELRSPLAAIKACATDLLDDQATHDALQTREALESIDLEADRLTRLIADLLDMSRIEAGLLEARIQLVDLDETLRESVDRIKRLRPLVNITITRKAPALVRADPIYLGRVLGNLLENGARAAEESGNHEMQVRIVRSSGKILVRVIDHGKGVPGQAKEQLFYPFYRIEERHPRLGPGLGLAITKGFVSLMGGDVWVQDTPGGGATFVFSLPAVQERARSRSQGEAASQAEAARSEA
jgi:two-component system, OmpR family, sensor histidine kinase KdpD